MNRLLLIFILSVLLYSCADTSQEKNAKNDVTKILEAAELAILNHQGIETDSMMQLRMEYYHKAKTFNESVHMLSLIHISEPTRGS